MGGPWECNACGATEMRAHVCVHAFMCMCGASRHAGACMCVSSRTTSVKYMKTICVDKVKTNVFFNITGC